MTVSSSEPEPLEIDAGLNEQLIPVASPLHDNATLPLNLFSADTMTVEVAEFPAAIGVGDRPELET